MASRRAGVRLLTWIGVADSISKAAVNMVAVKLARSLDKEGFTVLALHPGCEWLPLPDDVAPLDPPHSADLIVDTCQHTQTSRPTWAPRTPTSRSRSRSRDRKQRPPPRACLERPTATDLPYPFLTPRARRLKTLHSKTQKDNGSFWQWNGKPLEW